MTPADPEPDSDVRWDWPDGGGAPFDTSGDATRWLLVPMGYKTIQAAERLAVVDRGTVVREWPQVHVERPRPVYDPYQHHVPGDEPEGTFAVLDGRGAKRGPDGRWITHEHDSCAAAVAEARSMTDRRVLVVRLLTSKGWH